MTVRKKADKSSQMLTDIAIKGIQNKKGKDITIISLKEMEGSLFDYYIVCTGNSPSHIDSITDAIEMEIKQAVGLSPKRIEGLQNCKWVLLDYFDVIIHVMLEETRDFYKIEQMWKDAPQTYLENVQ